jgi:hypothetical protein
LKIVVSVKSKKMENLTIPENITFVTMDVTSLYTNIPHDDGFAADTIGLPGLFSLGILGSR